MSVQRAHQPARAAQRGRRRGPEPAAERGRQPGAVGRARPPAPDQGRNQLRGRVLVRRRDLDRVPGWLGPERDGRSVLRRVRLRAAGDWSRRHRLVRLLLARRPGPAVRLRLRPGPGDSFDAASARHDEVQRDHPATTRPGTRSQGGQLKTTTVTGDIYTDADRRRDAGFFHQTADQPAPDWVIETKVNAIELSGGYEQAGLLARVDDDNYVKFDILSDEGQTALNRIELRSEVGGAIQNPQPQLTPLPGQRRRRLAAADQDRHELQGRVLVRRHDVHRARGNGAERDGRADLRPVHARRQQRRRHRALRLPRRGRRPRRCESRRRRTSRRRSRRPRPTRRSASLRCRCSSPVRPRTRTPATP